MTVHEVRTHLRSVLDLLREVYDEWSDDGVVSHGAAISFYTFFSIAPVLVLAIAFAGLVFGRAAAEGEIVGQIQGAVGPDIAKTVQELIEQASRPASGIAATVISLLTMIFGASGVFGQLQASLNQIWGAPPKARSGRAAVMRDVLRRRVMSFGMVLSIGMLLLVSLVVSAVVGGVRDAVEVHAPVFGALLPHLNLIVSFAIITTGFALIYKVLPDVRLDWRDVWVGSAVTAILFTLGKGAIALYLAHASRASVYGAAGSLVLLLLWIYYSAQVVLIGAEFTEVYSRHFGSRKGAGRRKDRVRQGA
jgi:membrane protein